MARAKRSANKPAKRSTSRKSAAKKAAPRKAPKAAARRPTRSPKAAKPAAKKPSPRKVKEPVMEPREAEVDPVDEILEILACPPSTADQMSEVCEEALEAIQDNLPHVAAAELVWRERPERAELGAAITALIEELQRHAQVLASIHERLHPLAQDEGEHEDLDPAEVLDRIRPLLEQHAHDHEHDDHDHGDGADHGHVHGDN